MSKLAWCIWEGPERGRSDVTIGLKTNERELVTRGCSSACVCQGQPGPSAQTYHSHIAHPFTCPVAPLIASLPSADADLQAELKRVFMAYGPVEDITLLNQGRKRFAFVNYPKKEFADKVRDNGLAPRLGLACLALT